MRGRREIRKRKQRVSNDDDEESECGSLKYESRNKQIGNVQVNRMEKVPVIFPDGSRREIQWLGFSRIETSISEDAVHVKIPASSYKEKGIEFQVPRGQAISAIITERDSFPEGIGVFIRTRPATKKERERCLHDRHPSFISLD